MEDMYKESCIHTIHKCLEGNIEGVFALKTNRRRRMEKEKEEEERRCFQSVGANILHHYHPKGKRGALANTLTAARTTTSTDVRSYCVRERSMMMSPGNTVIARRRRRRRRFQPR